MNYRRRRTERPVWAIFLNLILLALAAGIFFFLYVVSYTAAVAFAGIVGLFVVIYNDRCGIGELLLGWLPESLRLHDQLRADTIAELIKTLTWLCTLLGALFSRWFQVAALVCAAVALLYYLWGNRRDPRLRFGFGPQPIHGPKEEKYSPIALAVLAPVIDFILSRGWISLQYTPLFIGLAALFTAAWIVPLLICTQEYRQSPAVIAGFGICVLLLGWMSLYHLNKCETAPATAYPVTITEVDSQHGGRGNFSLRVTVSTFADRTEPYTFDVDMQTYADATIGKNATVIVHQGLLCPWYELTVNTP